jgi:hypothetical protein
MSIQITKGLRQRIVARAYTVDQAVIEIKKYSNNYELMKPINRIYGDIDSKKFQGTEEEFNQKDLATRTAIETFLKDEPHSLMTASSFEHRIISWRFVLLKRMASIEDNKNWIIKNIETINLPDGVTFDSTPYAKRNQKMRMLGSSKDDENRPLRLAKGEVEDTLITFVDGCELMELPKEKKTKKKEVTVEPIHESLLERLVMNIDNNETTTWEQWYKVAQAIFNEHGSENLFLRWSSKSSKHVEREAIAQWNSLKKGDGLTVGSLFYWSNQSNSKEHEKIVIDCCPKDSYQYHKLMFEKTHFKFMFPAVYGFIGYENEFHLLSHSELVHQEKNHYCDGEGFIEKWFHDEYIRTYRTFVFKPKLSVSSDVYNLWNDFGIGKEGDISVVQDVLMTLCDNDKKVFDYVERWVAWILQFPSIKTETCIIFQSDTQGTGKDTYANFICEIFGRQYSANILDPVNEIFGKFNSQHKKRLLLKFEEAPFIDNKAQRELFKGLITCKIKEYEEKGHPSVTLDCYFNIMMTTNNKVPALLEDKERRMVLIKCGEQNVGKHDYWSRVHSVLNTQTAKDAYLHYLLGLDLTGWKAREDRPITKFYEEIKLSSRPYHAKFFQHKVEDDDSILKDVGMSGRDLLKAIQGENSKYEISETAIGRDLRIYIEAGALVKRRNKKNVVYTMTDKMQEFLETKGWWFEF